MAKSSLIIVMLVSIVMFYMARPSFSQEIDPYSEEVPEDVNISPSDFDIYVESPEEALFEEADAPAKEYDRDLIHHYTNKQLDFFEACAKKPSLKCGDEILGYMSDDTMTQMSDECCRDLLKMGKDCHAGLVQFIFSTYEYKNLASKAIPKSKQTWNNCLCRVESQIGAPVSLDI